MEELSCSPGSAGNFFTQLFAKYQRNHDWLEETIIQLYSRGMATRYTTDFLESLSGADDSHDTSGKENRLT